MTSKKTAVIFDLDGTLVDTSGDLVYSANHIRKSAGLPPLPMQEVLSHVGLGANHLIGKLLLLGDKEHDAKKSALLSFQEHYIQHQTMRSKIYPGIKNALERISEFAELFVLSNKPHPAVKIEIEKQGLLPFFLDYWGYDILDAPKPDPCGIHKAMALAESAPDRTVMVGDMRPDILAGERAGVHTCWVSWGFGQKEEDWPEPSFVADSAKNLVEGILDHIT